MQCSVVIKGGPRGLAEPINFSIKVIERSSLKLKMFEQEAIYSINHEIRYLVKVEPVNEKLKNITTAK